MTTLRNEAISPIQNKVGILLSNPYLRSMLVPGHFDARFPGHSEWR